MPGQDKVKLELELHEKQGVAFQSKATEILYGGAAGGGKSHLMRVVAIFMCLRIPGLQVYLFRRVRDDVIAGHIEGPQGFPMMLAPLIERKLVQIVGDEIRFWNRSKIHLCHCKDEQDRFKYLSTEIHVLLIDELTTFSEVIYRFLRNRVRAVGLEVPEAWKGRVPRIICSSNPGNVGHLWVKNTWIDRAEEGEIWLAPEEEGGMNRQFIRALLEDNPSMTQDDPGYEYRLAGLGSEALVRAMRWGDWDIVEGAFFPEFDKLLHVIEPFDIPSHWTRFSSLDWGSARPFSHGWYAVADDTEIPVPDAGRWPKCLRFDDRTIRFPRGAVIRYREWYGMTPNRPNVGVKLTAEEVAQGILQKESDRERLSYRVADPSMFSQDGGPSLAERMYRATNGRLNFRKADNRRVPRAGHIGGWDQCRAYLVGRETCPLFFCFPTSVHLIRTLPALQHDEARIEDVATDMEDHAPDEWRYALMSRPYVTAQQEEKRPRWPHELSFDEIVARRTRERVEAEW